MKISILLPYKENFSPSYPGAISIFLKGIILKSIYKKDINITAQINLNIYNNKKRLQLNIKDVFV